MGYVDTLTRFTHYNSYRLDPGEELFGTPFDVEFFSAINSQAQVICKGATSEGAMYMTWLAEDGSKLSRDEYEFDVTGRWVRQIWPNEPPEHAVRAMWSVKNTDDTEAWNVACAMTSAGEMAGAFDPSLAGHVSLLTASGLYTGTLTADQVVAGILQSLDGKAYFDLEKPEIVMQGNDATWKASPENPLRLEDEEGDFIGGLVRLPDGRMAIITSALGNAEDLQGGYLEVGRRADPSSGGVVNSGMFFKGLKSELTINEGYSPDTGEYSAHIIKTNNVRRMLFFASGSTVIRDAEGQNRLQIFADGTVYIIDTINVRYWQDSSGTFIQSPNLRNAIGADNTGPYYIKNNVKTYF